MHTKLLILLIFIFGFSFSVYSQEDTLNIGSKHKLRKVIKEKLMKKLEIDEITAEKFTKLYNEQIKLIVEYNKNKREIMKSIEENPDSKDVMNKIEELIEIDSKIIKARKDFISELQKFLTPKQIAQSIIFQKNLRKLFVNRREK